MHLLKNAFFGLGLYLSMLGQSDAYTFTQDFSKGFYWSSFPIKMNKFVVDADDGGLLEELTNQAALEWESAIGKNIWDFTSVALKSSYDGNHIRWSDNFGEETGYDPNRTLAITIRYSQGGFFQRTVIILNGNIDYLRKNWGNTLKTTILHELGHTLGLDHTSANAIMAANLTSLTSLQGDDIEGINAVVDETLRRQSIGFRSPFSADSTEKKTLVPTCGTIGGFDKDNTDPRNGLSFLSSMFLGLMIITLLNFRKNKKILIKY